MVNQAIQNAVVCMDLNANNACDAGEPVSARTGATGASPVAGTGQPEKGKFCMHAVYSDLPSCQAPRPTEVVHSTWLKFLLTIFSHKRVHERSKKPFFGFGSRHAVRYHSG